MSSFSFRMTSLQVLFFCVWSYLGHCLREQNEEASNQLSSATDGEGYALGVLVDRNNAVLVKLELSGEGSHAIWTSDVGSGGRLPECGKVAKVSGEDEEDFADAVLPCKTRGDKKVPKRMKMGGQSQGRFQRKYDMAKHKWEQYVVAAVEQVLHGLVGRGEPRPTAIFVGGTAENAVHVRKELDAIGNLPGTPFIEPNVVKFAKALVVDSSGGAQAVTALGKNAEASESLRRALRAASPSAAAIDALEKAGSFSAWGKCEVKTAAEHGVATTILYCGEKPEIEDQGMEFVSVDSSAQFAGANFCRHFEFAAILSESMVNAYDKSIQAGLLDSYPWFAECAKIAEMRL